MDTDITTDCGICFGIARSGESFWFQPDEPGYEEFGEMIICKECWAELTEGEDPCTP